MGRILRGRQQEILSTWVAEIGKSRTQRSRVSESEQRQQCTEFLDLLASATLEAQSDDLEDVSWQGVCEFLTDISRSRGRQGFSPRETALFVFSLKPPLVEQLRRDRDADPKVLFDRLWAATELLDRLGLFTTEVHQKAREEVIARQQEELLELSTPVIRLWEGVLALPMIGTLDSQRTQVVMEALLQRLVDERAPIAILDITGVPTVDTLTAQHLLKTVAAARLMGAECIISGVRPQIAQTIVHLGVDLGDVTTKATLADALQTALKRIGRTVTREA